MSIYSYTPFLSLSYCILCTIVREKKKHLCFRCLLWARVQDFSLHVSHPHLPSHCPPKEQFHFQPPTISSIIRVNSFHFEAPESEAGSLEEEQMEDNLWILQDSKVFSDHVAKDKIWMLELSNIRFKNLLWYQPYIVLQNRNSNI